MTLNENVEYDLILFIRIYQVSMLFALISKMKVEFSQKKVYNVKVNKLYYT